MFRSVVALRKINLTGDRFTLVIIAGGGIFIQFLTLVNSVIVARMLGVEGRGQVVLVSVVAAMGCQLTLGGGMPNAITKELASHRVRARDGLHGMTRGWAPWGLLGAAGAAGYFLATESGSINTTDVALAGGAATMALLGMTSRILVGSLLGEGAKPLTIAMTGVMPQFLAAVVLGTAMASGIRWSALEVVVVMVVTQALVLATRLRSLAPPTGLVEDRLDRSQLAKTARRTHVGSIGPLDGLALDRALVGSLIGSVALGLYSTAVALGSLAAMLGGALATVALPKIAAAQHLPRDQERAVVRRWVLMSAAVLIPTVAVFEFATPFVIPLLFGEEFRDAVPCGYWYIAASGFLAFRRVLIVTLQGRGRGGVASWIELALTPLVFVAVLVASIGDEVQAVGIGMLGVGVVSVVALGMAVVRLEPVSVGLPVREAADEAVT